MSASDAVILLIGDGLVAAGRVLGGLRRRCDTERRAARFDVDKCSYCPVNDGLVCEGSCADALAAYESGVEALEPDELWVPDGPSAMVSPEPSMTNRFNADAIQTLRDTLWCYAHGEMYGFCKHQATVCRLEREPGEVRSAPASRPDCAHDSLHGIPGESYWYCNSCPATIPQSPQRSAAVTVPAADNTTEVDHLEAAYNYHRPQANYNGDLVWGCEGCGWGGPTIQAHSRHRFQVLADMKNATTRIQEQLGGAS